MMLLHCGKASFLRKPAKLCTIANKRQFNELNFYKSTYCAGKQPQFSNQSSIYCNFSRGFATKKGNKEEDEGPPPNDEEEEEDDEDENREDDEIEEDLGLHPDEIESNRPPQLFKETVGRDKSGEKFLNANLFLNRLLTNDPNNYDPYDYNIGSVLKATRKEFDKDFSFLGDDIPVELRRNTFFSISDDLLTELPSAIKAENPYHEEILQRGRSVMRMLGVDSAFIEQIPEVDFGFSQIELIGLFDKYMVEKMGFQYMTTDPTGYNSKMGHFDSTLNRPTQFGTFDMWNGMQEKFELEKKAAGKPFPVNIENLRRDLLLIGKQQYGIDIKVNDFVKAAEASVAPVNLSPLFDSGDSKEVNYVKQFLRTKGNQEIEQVLTPKFAEEDSYSRPLTSIEFLLYFTHKLKSMITDSGAKIIPERITEEDEEDEEEEEGDVGIDEDDLIQDIQNSGYSLLHEHLVPDKYKHSFMKSQNEDHPLYDLMEEKDDQLEDEAEIYEDPEWDAKLGQMEDDYGDLNYSILQNPVYRRRIVKDKLQDKEPEKVEERYAMQDAKELLDLENNIYSINECFLCKFDIHVEPMNVPLLQRFMNGSGQLYPRRQMKTCRKHQNKVAIAIKRAKAMGIFSSKDLFRIRSPFNDEEVDILDLDIPVLTVLTEEQADEIEKDRIIRGVYNDYESYGTGVKIMFHDDVDLRRLNEDNLGDILKEYQDKVVNRPRSFGEEDEEEDEDDDEPGFRPITRRDEDEE